MNAKSRLKIWLWLVLLCFPASLVAQTLPRDADLRLLVDVSGSMQATDPDKLREPALELLVRLMPEGVRAGIWAFGTEVEALVPHRPVDASWQNQAREAISGLESRALFTHIGAALESASYDRSEPDPGRDAHIILLTDGMVDVSPDAAVNAREQERVVRELVPELSAAGYRIHTIGLSDRADKALLQEIARAADGLFIEARSADQLMESLLGVFQQSVATNALPIEDGRFLVDESVREFTALIMRPEGASNVQLVSPDGDQYGKEIDGKEGAKPGLNWHHTADYDLITQTKPQSGYWSLRGDLAQSSRVSVISNMQLQVEPLTTNPLAGQEQHLEFWLQNEQGPITDPDLLSLLDIKVRLEGPGERFPMDLRWTGDQVPGDGRYQMTLPGLNQPGDYRLTLELDGKTFQRHFSHRMKLGSLFSVDLEQHEVDGEHHYRVEVKARQPLDGEATSLVAHLQDSSGFSRVQPLSHVGEGRWQVDLKPERKARYRVGLRARGRTRDAVDFEQQLPSLYFTYPPEGVELSDPLDEALTESQQALKAEREALEKSKQGESAPQPESEVVLGAEPEIRPQPKAAPEVQSEPDSVWRPVFLYGGVVLLNLAFLALAYWGYRRIVGPGAEPSAEEPDDEQNATQASAPPPMQEIEPEPDDDAKTEFELELEDDEPEPEAQSPEAGTEDEAGDETGAQEETEDLDRLDLSEDEDSLFSLEDDQDADSGTGTGQDSSPAQTGEQDKQSKNPKDQGFDDGSDPKATSPKE